MDLRYRMLHSVRVHVIHPVIFRLTRCICRELLSHPLERRLADPLFSRHLLIIVAYVLAAAYEVQTYAFVRRI